MTNLSQVVGTCRKIPIGNGVYAIVDEHDFNRVSMHPWHALTGANGSARYARSSMKVAGYARARTVLLHRFVLGVDGAEIVDHINGDGLDNRRANLRIASAHQSATNRGARGVIGLNGVRHSGRKFLASIAPNGQEIYLGTFNSSAEAAVVYNAAAVIAYGEFARLNPGGSAPDILAQVIEEKQRNADRLIAEIKTLKGG